MAEQNDGYRAILMMMVPVQSCICVGSFACDWLACDLQISYSVLIEADSRFIGSRTWREKPWTQTILCQRWTRHHRKLSTL